MLHSPWLSSCDAVVALQMALLTPDLIQSLQQMRQQPQQQQRHPHQQQAWPGGQPNGAHMPPHSMMGPVIPPPRPPQGPPPPGQPPHIPHSASLFGPPHFGVMSSNAMDGRPHQGPPQEPQGSRLRQGGPGWSLSHGMDGSDRSGNRQEPMLAADMVWDSNAGQGHPRSALRIPHLHLPWCSTDHVFKGPHMGCQPAGRGVPSQLCCMAWCYMIAVHLHDVMTLESVLQKLYLDTCLHSLSHEFTLYMHCSSQSAGGPRGDAFRGRMAGNTAHVVIACGLVCDVANTHLKAITRQPCQPMLHADVLACGH